MQTLFRTVNSVIAAKLCNNFGRMILPKINNKQDNQWNHYRINNKLRNIVILQCKFISRIPLVKREKVFIGSRTPINENKSQIKKKPNNIYSKPNFLLFGQLAD